MFKTIFIFCTAIFLFSPSLFSQKLLSGNEQKLKISTAETNYYISTILNEAKSSSDIFDDYIVSAGTQPVMQFTRLSGRIIDFYFFISDPEDIKLTKLLLEKNKTLSKGEELRISDALNNYSNLKPSYLKTGLYDNFARTIETTTNIKMTTIMDKKSTKELDDALYNYLISNNIYNLSEVLKNRELTYMIVNKFYMLPTTCLYREWAYIKAFKNYLGPLSEKVQMDFKPLKVKVYACSTGEEAVTLAIELAESGIIDFYILGSDINEASLETARTFRYPYSAYEMLPTEKQLTFKKYFKLNEQLKIWEPKDNKFFSSRIKYINHDMLKELPKDIGPEFEPPYDIMSILNVLLYIDNSAIDKAKDYWANLLRPGSILILHDMNHSVGEGTMGYDWAFKNFFSANAWVNVKTSRKKDLRNRLEILEQTENKFSEQTLSFIFNAYIYLGNSRKAVSLANKYLRENPNSFYAMNMLLNYYAKKSDADKIKRITNRMSYIYPFISELLDWISIYSAAPADKEYFKSLKQAFMEFKADYKTNPDIISRISALKESTPTETSKIYFLLTKTYALELQQELFLSEKHYKDMDSTKDEAVSNIREIVSKNPSYISSGILFSFIMENYLSYCDSLSLNDKAVQFCRSGIEIFEKTYPSSDFFYINYCIGNLYLNLASIADKSDKMPDAQKYAKSAILFFERALPYLMNLNFSTARYLYSNIGEAYLLDGKYYAQNGDLVNAKDLFNKSLIYLEKNLEISPIYGSKAVKLRKELYNLKEKYKI